MLKAVVNQRDAWLPLPGTCQAEEQTGPTQMEGPTAALLAGPFLQELEEARGSMSGQEGIGDHPSSCQAQAPGIWDPCPQLCSPRPRVWPPQPGPP